MKFSVSVRGLVEFCCRRGDIDFRFTPSPSGAQGIEGHQHLYRKRPQSYCSEFPVLEQIDAEGMALEIRGRADGYDPVLRMVEEIKTCRVAVSDIPEASQSVHLAQAKIYGALIARAEQLSDLLVRLTYLHIDTLQESSFDYELTRDELDVHLFEVVGSYTSWLAERAQHKKIRNESLANIKFCHGEFRQGQREMAELVYKCQAVGGQLLAEAPTGIGKTAATLFPALKGLYTSNHDQLVYLTAKSSGREVAEQTMLKFVDQGLPVNVLSLTAKDKICFSPGKACHADDCRFARGYYDRRQPAMVEALQHELINRETVEEVARAHDVCPYQLAGELIVWVDVLVCDYHYAYGLTASLGEQADTTLRRAMLVDEAHNLPTRARDMYGAGLAKEDLMAARRQADGAVRKSLDQLNRLLLDISREEWSDYRIERTLPTRLPEALQRFTAAVSEKMGVERAYLPTRIALMDFFFQALQFLRVAENFADDFQLEYQRDAGKQSLVLRLVCLDPGRLLALRHQWATSTVLFSATLAPLGWTASALGLSQSAVSMSLESPFDPDQLRVRLECGVDTRYKQRENSMQSLRRVLCDWVGGSGENCIVFFPSYAYLSNFLESLDAMFGSRPVWIQSRNQNELDRQALLDLLRNEREVVAFCILGGVFGEGVDLPGDALSRVAIVGVGMPQFNRTNESLRDHYQVRTGSGFDYAYVFPGMQKVSQALGRVIRTETDRGEALLIDSRYRQAHYRGLLPQHWTIENYS
ncbi:MAG: DNA excision repair protein ERCC-2 [Halieaceae bacterium]|jgi:DNA excision repair protein ERCC-2